MKFKVGDRVAVYPKAFERMTGIIDSTHITDYTFMVVKLDERYGSDVYTYHPKQCRRLVKKPRRRVWIFNPDAFDAGYVSDVSKKPLEGYVEFIEALKPVEFIEVKKK